MRTRVPYPNAKAVNKTFERERRTDKRHAKVHRFVMPPRIKNIPGGHAFFPTTNPKVQHPQLINLPGYFRSSIP